MISLNRKENGFTVIELLIVIIVIGILSTLILVTLTDVQRKIRNSERQSDIKSVAAHLEIYMAQNSVYPTLANLNDNSNPTWVSQNLKGLDNESRRDPQGKTYVFTTTSTGTHYGYAVTNDSGGSCDNSSGNSCTHFTLTYNEEGGSQQSVRSLN